MPPRVQAKSSFDVHPSVAMAQSIITGMQANTGRSLEDWLEVVRKGGPSTEKERREWLKTKHGLGTNYAACVAEISVGKGEIFSPEGYLRLAGQYVEQLFAGPKAGLRPIYEALLAAGRKLGKDVRVCPCQTFVPLYRKHVFAQIKPTTRTRIDLGLALKDTRTPARLIDTGGFAKKDRITRRIEVSSLDDIDGEVLRWLKTAYEMDA
ncbi:MAG TPA: DUF5655 domain-containing protein [Bryobacteraceae bacterium]|nr:DUF5655 domain-containing protein [Bryobacteraceae bacterium]